MSQANRLVVVAGVGCPKKVIEQAADDLCDYYQAADAAPFTYYQANHQPQELSKALAERAEVVTHSAGMIAVSEVLDQRVDEITFARPIASLVALNPPMPTLTTSLVLNASKVMAYNLKQMVAEPDKQTARRHRQLATAYALGSSLKDLPKLSQIASFNAIANAHQINRQFDCPVGVVAAKEDEYFPAAKGYNFIGDGLAYCEVEGQHDRSLVRPVDVLGETGLLSFIREYQGYRGL